MRPRVLKAVPMRAHACPCGLSQEVYAVGAVRKIFDRLAHSSIMRLSETRCGYV